MDWGRKWLVDFNAEKTQLVLLYRSNNTTAIDMKMDGSFLLEIDFLGLTFSSKLDWGSYIISIAKNGSKKIGVLICSMKFLLRLLCISIDLPYAHAYNTSCYLELLDKLQKWICRTVGASLATSLKSLGHCWKVASLCLFYRYYFGRYLSELAQLVPIPSSQGRSTCYFDRLHTFSVNDLDVTRMSMPTVSFLVRLDSEFTVYKILSFKLQSKLPKTKKA